MAALVWHGMPEFEAALQRLNAEMGQACRRGADNAAKAVATATKAKLTTSTHRKGTPTPSRPGEPPSLVTGQLRRSVKIVAAEPRGTAWVAKVGPTAVYSRIQELGGATGRGGATTLPARPYLTPAVRELADNGALWAAFRSGWELF